ncbi:IS66 family insertion sequence element accessory protein TnpA [Vibrio cidicii]|uniref:IS66 family insertion sequence element accessory protein TnpA n=1 Tax=Vibrio cidicii TaxID=1763883 RepID=UPI000ACF4149|nr:hypothetical protein [Vibrio cidicii]
MRKLLTNQEWQMLIEQSESSSLSTLAFCKLLELNPSTFYAKRQHVHDIHTIPEAIGFQHGVVQLGTII